MSSEMLEARVDQQLLSLRSEIADMLPRLFAQQEKKLLERLDTHSNSMLAEHRRLLQECQLRFDQSFERLDSAVAQAEEHANMAKKAQESLRELLNSAPQSLL